MLHLVLWLAYLIKSSKAIKVGGKQKPYKMWQAGISLAASPLAKSLAGFMAALPPRARPLTNPASYAGYRGLYSYRQRVRVIAFFPKIFRIVSACWASSQKFLKGKSDAY